MSCLKGKITFSPAGNGIVSRKIIFEIHEGYEVRKLGEVAPMMEIRGREMRLLRRAGALLARTKRGKNH